MAAEIVAAALLGAAIGSFLNVVIHRLPLGESLVSPGSHCPHCNSPVRARDNVPVLSWLLLRTSPVSLRAAHRNARGWVTEFTMCAACRIDQRNVSTHLCVS